jgi:hypothetical protein
VNVSCEIKSEQTGVARRGMKLSLPGVIIGVTCVQVAAGLATFAGYVVSKNEIWIRIYFDYLGALFFVGVGALEFFLTLLARRQFYADEPLRNAWSLIMLASSVRWLGLAFANWFNVPSYINPRFYFVQPWDAQSAASLREFGLLLGPIHMFLLAAGLGVVLRLYKRLGILAAPKSVDYLLLALVLAFTLRQGNQIYHLVSQQTDPVTLTAVLNWITDPLLSCLLVEAILVRRAVVGMGWGLISKSWGAYTAAIFLTSLAHMLMWADGYGYIRWQVGAIAWYLWFVVTAAYALGPAYQAQASVRAKQQLQV